jgi:hypothetical protein
VGSYLARFSRDAPNFLYSALDKTACSPFFKERRMRFAEPTNLPPRAKNVEVRGIRNRFPDDLHGLPSTRILILRRVSGVGVIDIEVFAVGAENGESPCARFIVADGHSRQRRLAASNHVSKAFSAVVLNRALSDYTVAALESLPAKFQSRLTTNLWP